MPSSRRLKVTSLVALLTVCVVFYITNGARNTHNSPFYTRTVEAVKERESAEARKDIIAEEKQRMERVERLQEEHNVAMSVAQAEETKLAATVPGQPHDRQKPIGADSMGKYGEGGKPVAGRKMMNDGKVVHDKSGKAEGDGVAKVGNIGPQSSHAVVGETEESEEDHKIEVALNEILKKGPIIIFSKTYCPFSKKAKNILLNQYSITPPPYVVELDQHELGSGLQAALLRTTGRRTVPNILINGRSIGGGDEVEAMHNDNRLASTITSMGGKRIMKVERKKDGEEESPKKSEMKFKA